jgi:hypothetical protein
MIDPTERQRQAKARFWQRFEKNPLLGNAEALSEGQMIQLAGDQNVLKWAKQSEEMWNWFFDKDYAKSVLKSGLEIAVRALITTCQEPVSKENPQSARIKAAETLLKFGGMEPDKAGKGEKTKNPLDSMSPEELEEFVRTKTKGLQAVNSGKKSG